jgi:hypothetical protein
MRWAGNLQKPSEEKTSFCEQKEAKKLYHAGPWALSPTPLMAQHSQKFLRRFFQKAAAFPTL